MTASNSLARLRVLLSLLFCFIFLVTHPPTLPAEEPATSEKPKARSTLPPLTAQVSPEEALAAVKRRSQKILATRRAAKRFKFSGDVSQETGYETNPSNSSSRKGDTYFQESASLSLSKKLTSTLDWSSSYAGSYLKYLDYGDGDYTDHTLTATKLKWQPGKIWRVESWTDLEYNFYPTALASGYRNWKLVGRMRQNLLKSWYHQVQYEYFIRDYTSKKARDGAGNDTLSHRVDTRHRLRYKVGTTVRKALLSWENEFYWHDSNDARNDFYDAQVWKTTGSASGNLTKKLYLSGSFAFERKNYTTRKVSGINAEARYDDKYTLSSSASYDLNNTWKLAYAFSFDHLASNEPTGEYDNAKHLFTVTARF